MRGRGKDEDCRRSERVPEVPEVHIDFMFMGEDKSQTTLAMLVATQAVMCCVAPRNSSGE